MKKIAVKFGESLVKFKFEDFSESNEDVNFDKLLKIDYSNLFAEIISWPVIYNKIGILQAEMENELRLAKLNFKIKEAKLKNQIRINLIDENGKATVGEIDENLIISKKYRIYQEQYFEVEKQRDYISSLYLAARDKSEKLNKLSLTLRPGDIDDKLIEKQLNNIYFKIKENE